VNTFLIVSLGYLDSGSGSRLPPFDMVQLYKNKNKDHLSPKRWDDNYDKSKLIRTKKKEKRFKNGDSMEMERFKRKRKENGWG